MSKCYQFSKKQQNKIRNHQNQQRAWLLDVMRQTAIKINASPNTHELEEALYPQTIELYIHYFGGLGLAREMVDFDAILDPATRIYRSYDSDEALLAGIRRLAAKLGCDVLFQDINKDPTIPAAYTYSRRFGDCKTINQLANVSKVLMNLGIIPDDEGYLDEHIKTKLQNIVLAKGMPLVEYDFTRQRGLPSFDRYLEAGVNIAQLNDFIGARELLRANYAYIKPSMRRVSLDDGDRELLLATLKYTHQRICSQNIKDLAGLLSVSNACQQLGGIDNVNLLL